MVNQAGGNADSVAEHTLAMLLSLSRHMMQCDGSVAQIHPNQLLGSQHA